MNAPAQVPTGGGAWRLRWHPQDPSLILAACMYNGFAVARVGAAWDAIEIVESYKGHESIAYGADWHPTAAAAGRPAAAAEGELAGGGADAGEEGEGVSGGGEGEGGTSLVATCSFYDRRLHLWTPATRARLPVGQSSEPAAKEAAVTAS